VGIVTTKNGKTPRVFAAGPWAFLPVERAGRNQALLYVKVPVCVLYVSCYYCKAEAGERCRGDNGPTTQVHVGRKSAFRRLEGPDLEPVNLGAVSVV
jgi:hypothetical protein